MKSISFKNDNENKRLENVKVYQIVLLDGDEQVTPQSDVTYTAKLGKEGTLVKQVALDVVEDHLELPTKKLLDLPAGKYELEIWGTGADCCDIYPDHGTAELNINSNLQDLPQGTVTSLTLDEFINNFNQAVKNNTTGNIKLDDYYTKEQANSTFAKLVDIPKPADLSDYAKKESLPEVSIDTEHRTVTINGTTLQVPEVVDLSKLASKDDLQGLVKATELASYAKKTDLPNMSQYATATNVQSLINSMKGQNKSPMTYDLNRTAADLQNPFDQWQGFYYSHGNNISIGINDFNQDQVKQKKPEPGVDYARGLDGIIKKVTGYTGATGEYWLSFEYIKDCTQGVYIFNKQEFTDNQMLDYSDLKLEQCDWWKYYITPGDLLIDKNNNIFEVGACYWPKKAELVQLNREAKKSE